MLCRTAKRICLDSPCAALPSFLLPAFARLSTATSTSTSTSTSDGASPSVRALLPLLASQSNHYITAHIHGRPYLLTQGDTLRLPFLMPGVRPGDVLRLNCASNLGSRDFTLKAASQPREGEQTINQTTHFVYNRLAGLKPFLDEAMYVCRAVVLGTEAEPMRVKEKTKRRQRKVKKVKSKHRFTVLRVKELTIRQQLLDDNSSGL